MFDFVRTHTKIIMGILFLLVIPSFALFGLEGYRSFNDGADTVAHVNGKKVTQSEWDRAHRAEVERARASNPNVDMRLLDSPEVKYGSLERLVRDRVLEAAAADQHVAVSDVRLATELSQDPTIAALRKADGTLDIEQYRRLLASQGLTPESFEAGVRRDLAARQMLDSVTRSGLASQAQADMAIDLVTERREARVVRFTPSEQAGKLKPTDAELEAWYTAHVSRFQAPESANIEYVVLDLDSVKRAVTVNEEALRTYYKENAARLGAPEQRRASHVLIEAAKDAPAADRAKAKARAEELLAQLRQAPNTFAEVARQSSQDSASAASGGDLGLFLRDKGIDPAIANAAFALAKPGDLSGVVESDFGYHIVQLTEVKPATVPSFEAERARLEDQVRTQLAQKQFAEMAEVFTNGVYEQSDSLKPVADKLKLTIQTANNVSRTPAADASGPLANARFLTALFSADALEKKRNTEAIDLGSNQLVSGRVVQHVPARARPFAEVKNEVRTAFIAERGAELARQEGQARLKAWTEQPASATGLPAPVTISRNEPDTPPALVEAVLRADPAKLPVFVGADLGAQGYAVARVEKVLPRSDLAKDVAAQGRAQYERAWGNVEALQYYEWLKARYKVDITAPKPAATALR